MIYSSQKLVIKTKLDNGRLFQIGENNFFEVSLIDRLCSSRWSVGEIVSVKRSFGSKYIIEQTRRSGKTEIVEATLLS